MSGPVWMRHPDLPSDQLIRVDEASVPHHRAAGWTVTKPPPVPEAEPDDSPDDAGVSVSEPASEKPRRRAPKEGEEK